MSTTVIRYSSKHEDELVALYVEDEMSLSEIERETGVPYRTVWNILVRRDVPRRPTGASGRGGIEQVSTVDLQRTVWLHEQGLTYEQMGAVLGLKVSGVKYRIGLARRRLAYRGTNRGREWGPVPPHVKRAVEAWR